jgi:hypothetical protein
VAPDISLHAIVTLLNIPQLLGQPFQYDQNQFW